MRLTGGHHQSPRYGRILRPLGVAWVAAPSDERRAALISPSLLRLPPPQAAEQNDRPTDQRGLRTTVLVLS